MTMAVSNRLRMVRADDLWWRARCDGTASVPMVCEVCLVPCTGKLALACVMSRLPLALAALCGPGEIKLWSRMSTHIGTTAGLRYLTGCSLPAQ